MKNVVKVVFEYEDGTKDAITDPMKALLFQSRCNSSGILAGMYDAIEREDNKESEEQIDAEKSDS